MDASLKMALVLAIASAVTAASDANSVTHRPGRELLNGRMRQGGCTEPGCRKPAPHNVSEVLIGYFGPTASSDPQTYRMYRAACTAIERANKTGGYDGLPFRLVSGWSVNPWESGAAEVVRMAYVHKVWAIIGGMDGPSTHLAEQVVAKARLTLMSPASTDRSVNAANVPWMFSCLPGDHLQAPVVAQAIASHVGSNPFVLVSAVDHDSHVLTVELRKSLARRRLAPQQHFEFKTGQKDYSLLAEKCAKTTSHALVLIAAAEESARLTCAMRKTGFKGIIFGGPQMGTRAFMESAGTVAEGVIFPMLYASSEEPDEFEKELAALCGNRPDYLAAHAYDSVSLLIAAIRSAGLDRRRIRDAVRGLSRWHGVTGHFDWDSLGGNTRPVELGTIRAGRAVCISESSEIGETTDPSASR